MKVENTTTQPAVDSRRLRADELTQVGATLTEQELQAVSGARMSVSWTCGSLQRADEWTL
ncbi:hypothetical protein [Piscinibacter sp. XHJ-5]|uniref:hypothetical protein n=1 Tax=Piscinibacter sp. XHJ-5 TaxID=3037797 RepID=UPI0024533F87|nr:hypothetical protein [Piscinibacter sp. XHJ-5]